MATVEKPGYFTPATLGPHVGEFYREQGFLVVTEALADSEVAQLRDETLAICRGRRGDLTRGETAEARTAIGVPKAAGASAEEMASLSDDELLARFLCIHFPHKCSEIMCRTLAHPVIVDVLTRIIGPNVKCMQSMLFIKAAGKPGQAWHQDEDYIPTRDRSLCGAWIALDDATLDNGCLHIIPGSHRPGVLWPQYPHDDRRFDCAFASYDFPYQDSESVPVEVPRGSVVFFNGYTLHRSLPNRLTRGFRRALVNHYMSAESFLPWHQQPEVSNAKNDYRDIVMVAGVDPYAWKGVQQIARPHVRAAGDGGCGDGRIDIDEFKRRAAAERATL
jgi:phytanoyl-CoA hydroxylase